MVLGGGTIADLIERERRGTAMAVWMMGPSKSSHKIDATGTDDFSHWTLHWTGYWRFSYRRERLEMELLARRYSRTVTSFPSLDCQTDTL
jgi:hypothetical protein